jgi:hypothetical protein
MFDVGFIVLREVVLDIWREVERAARGLGERAKRRR